MQAGLVIVLRARCYYPRVGFGPAACCEQAPLPAAVPPSWALRHFFSFLYQPLRMPAGVSMQHAPAFVRRRGPLVPLLLLLLAAIPLAVSSGAMLDFESTNTTAKRELLQVSARMAKPWKICTSSWTVRGCPG